MTDGHARSTLEQREAKVLRFYFGLDNQEPMTLEEIGSHLGLMLSVFVGLHRLTPWLSLGVGFGVAR